MIYLNRPHISEQDKKAVLDVLSSSIICQGDVTRRLEMAFATVCQADYAVAVSSGTAALFLALKAHGIGPGDEVITTPFSFIATASSIVMTGATPVFVDIDPNTFNIDPVLVGKAINSKTKAILPVHLYGLPANIYPLLDLCENVGIPLIADAAQALGSTYYNRPVGHYCTSCYSLYATKLITGAELGMVVTNDEQIANQCRLLRSHGFTTRYISEQLGYNLRTSELHSALALSQLSNVQRWTQARQLNALEYDARLFSVTTPRDPNGDSSWHQYTVRTNRRDELRHILAQNDIQSQVFYPVPLHKQPWIRKLVGDVSPPHTEQLVEEVLSIPVHQYLSEADVDHIIKVINSL
jgi:perosamine synthetase